MANCPNCQASLPDGTKFCPYCGSSVQSSSSQSSAYTSQPYNTPEPSVVIPPQTEHGSIITDTNPWLQADNTPPAPKKKKGSAGKIILFAALGLLLLGIVAGIAIFAFSFFLGGDDIEIPDYTLFYQDGELYYWDFDSDRPIQVTQRLLSDNDMDTDDAVSFVKYDLSYSCKINSDGDRLFYPDKNNDTKDYEDGYNLYYRNPDKTKEEPVKIDSSVTSFDISTDGNIVVYLKEGNLYQLNIKENQKDKFANDVTGYILSADGESVIFMTKDKDLYIKQPEKDKEKIVSEIESVHYYNDDFTVVYYLKENTLYKHPIGGEREKIASDVTSVLQISDNGDAYYYKSEETEISLNNYVEDDMAKADSEATEPVEPVRPTAPTRPSYWDYDTYEEYQSAYEKYTTEYAAYEVLYDQYLADYDEYKNALSEYRKIESRNNMREELKTLKYTQKLYSLYFYSVGEETKIADKLTDTSYSSTETTEGKVIVYYKTTGSEPSKVKFSDLYENNYYDYASFIRNMITEAQESGTSYKIAIGKNTFALEQEDAYSIRIADDGSAVYYKANLNDEKSTCDLYKAVIKDDKLEKAELYDTDVSDMTIRILNVNQIAYFKEYKDDKGDLYVDKEKIDFDVYVYQLQYSEEDKSIIYFADWNDEKHIGTLKKFKKEESIKIADDVYSYSLIPSGKILYLNDYSTERCKGTLYYFEKDESVRVADDVVAEFQCIW